ncbi:sporulation domain-containing protein [Chitinispirillum alkaliphilum]|nr:sporulation domain-containing protein [Chitinispirillum alkaliphilum]
MYRGKFLITGIVCTAVIFGCSNTEEPVDKEFTAVPRVAESFETDTRDVFDEFFQEDSPSAKSEEVKREPQTKSPIQEVRFTESGRYVVQVSTVGERRSAEKLISDLENRGYPAYIAEVENPTPQLYGEYYRVRIGGFTGVSQARAFGENVLRNEGLDFWVDNRANDNVGIVGSGFGTTESTWSSEPTPRTTTPSTGSAWENTTPSATPVSDPSPKPAEERTITSQPAEPEPTEKQTETLPPPPPPEPATTDDSPSNGWGTDDWGSGW